MNLSRTVRAWAALAALSLPAAAAAHHSFNAFFRMDAFVEVEGRVTEVDWTNPHIRFYLEPSEAAGEIWEIEAGPTNLLSRMGIEPGVIGVGDTLRARGNPSRRDPRALWVTNVLLADGTEILANPMAERYWESDVIGDSSALFAGGDDPAGEARSIFRIWTPPITSMPMPQGDPVLTAAGQRAQAVYEEGETVIEDCELPGVPFAMISPYPIQLVDRGDRILIRMEAYDQERVVHMAPSESEPAPSRLGYSVGRWEQGGDTLVVETSRLDYHSFGDLGPAQSDRSRVVERFTLSPDGSELAYEATITDPVMLDGAWTWAGGFVYREDEELQPWNCGVPR